MKQTKQRSLAVALAALLAAAACAAQAQAPASAPTSPAKKELVQRLLTLQQGAVEAMSRAVIGAPVSLLVQRAGNLLQTQVPTDKREAIGKAMDADVRQFVDDAVPLLRERALKLAPQAYGSALEEKFTEDELRQIIAWMESPVNRKLQQLSPDMEAAFVQKLRVEADSLLGAKLQALERKLGATLGVAPSAAASGARPAAPAPKAAK